MSDAGNTHELHGIVNGVYNPPIAHADTPLVLVPSELFASWRAWVLGKRQNLAVYPGKEPLVEGVRRLLGG